MKFQNARIKFCKKCSKWHLDLYIVMYFNLENRGDVVTALGYMCVHIRTCLLPVHLQLEKQTKRDGDVKKYCK